MKKHLSVFGLFARSSVDKVLGILGLMFIAEALVAVTLRRLGGFQSTDARR